MRRAAALAIALVAGLLLLMSGRTGPERSTGRPAPPDEIPATSAREPPETEQDPQAPKPATPEAIADGVVIDRNGAPVAGYMVFAIPRSEEKLWDMHEPGLPRGDAPEVPSSSTDARGAFAFRGLAPGDYRLALSESWTPDAPVTFRHDQRGLRVVAALAWTAEVVALDLETSEPIPRFLFRYHWPPGSPEEHGGDGSDGVFRARLIRDVGTNLVGLVVADGYHAVTTRACAGQEPATKSVWLARDVEPRLALRVQFEDGAPCEEEATVFVQHRAERRNAILPAVRDGGGRYRVPLPAGSWLVDFRPAHSEIFREECSAEVHLRTGERSEVFLTLVRGGDIVVRRKEWDGTPWNLAVFGEMRVHASITVTSASQELRHVRPGRYALHASSPREAQAGGLRGLWARDVEVTTGSRHELTIE